MDMHGAFLGGGVDCIETRRFELPSVRASCFDTGGDLVTEDLEVDFLFWPELLVDGVGGSCTLMLARR